jgi:hypothetical protein
MPPALCLFIKSAPENPVLWTGMKGVSAKNRKNLNQMLKRVQHDNRVRVSFFCHPEPGPEVSNVILNLFQDQDLRISGSRFLVLRIWVLKPRPVGGVLYLRNYQFFFRKTITFDGKP